jgi:DNA-binding MarR family transcriptional regulator
MAPDAAAAPEVETDLAWSLLVAARTFGQWARDAVADLPGGQRGHLVLATIARGLPRSQLALAQQLGVDKTAMTYLLDELEEAGLIERRPDPADRRARQILSTELGRCTLANFKQRLDAASEKLLEPLSCDEALAFRSMIERIAHGSQPGTSPCSAALDVPDC